MTFPKYRQTSKRLVTLFALCAVVILSISIAIWINNFYEGYKEFKEEYDREMKESLELYYECGLAGCLDKIDIPLEESDYEKYDCKSVIDGVCHCSMIGDGCEEHCKNWLKSEGHRRKKEWCLDIPLEEVEESGLICDENCKKRFEVLNNLIDEELKPQVEEVEDELIFERMDCNALSELCIESYRYCDEFKYYLDGCSKLEAQAEPKQ